MNLFTCNDAQSYMEERAQDQDRLHSEWQSLCQYDPGPCSIIAAIQPTNERKNRSRSALPCQYIRAFIF